MKRLLFSLLVVLLAGNGAARGWLDWFGSGGIASLGDTLVVAANEAGDPAGGWTDTYSGDLAGRQLRISVLSHDWGAVSLAEVIVSTEGNFDEYFHADLRAMLSAPEEGEWIDLTVPAGAWTASDGADWSTVNGLVLRVTSHTGRTAVVAFSGIVFLAERVSGGALTIAFDDARSDVWEHAFPLMQERGLRGTVYAIPELIGHEGYLTQQQLYALHQAGWEIGAHGEHPLIWLSESELNRHLRFAAGWLSASGFGSRLGYAYPNGLYNADVAAAVASRFDHARTINAVTDIIGHASRYALGGVSVYPELEQATLELLIDRAAEGGEWLTVVFHLFSPEPEVDTQFPPERFESLLDHALARGITVMTTSEAWRWNLTVAVCGVNQPGLAELTPGSASEAGVDCSLTAN